MLQGILHNMVLLSFTGVATAGAATVVVLK